VVRLTLFVVDRDEYVRSRGEIGRHYRLLMGKHYPAMTLVEVSALLEPGARVEIEATAAVP
jgi:enamine deaminase RidA (YjgF/YER057c/UK114 family)